MGMGKWFDAVKKLFSCAAASENKANDKLQKRSKSINSRASDQVPSNSANVIPSNVALTLTPLPLPGPPPLPTQEGVQEVRLAEIESEQNKHAYSVALASAVAAEAAAIAAQAAAEAAHLAAITATTTVTTTTRVAGKSKEEASLVRIQTAFRGYLARRALRGLVRLKNMVDASAVKRRTTDAVRFMQTFTRIQTQIRSRRIRMLEQNQTLQRQLQLKRQTELEKSKIGEDWDDSMQSKERIEASLLYRQEAALRRERALAYAFTHQWRNSSRAVILTFTDPNNPGWGWSWMERWMITRPQKSHTVIDKDTKDHAKRDTVSGQIHSMPQKSSRPPSRQSLWTPPAKAGRSASPEAGANHKEEGPRSTGSLRSERPAGRHRIASLILDAASNTSMRDSPTCMQSAESKKAKSCAHYPSTGKSETPGKGTAGSAKRRLSFTVADKPGVPSPVKARRHSGPPKVDAASVKAS